MFVVSYEHDYCIFILFHFSESITVFVFVIPCIFYRHFYSFQHISYISCRYANKSSESSKGEVTTNNASVELHDLLPYSWYSVEVAAYTVQYGRAVNVTGHTMELGKLFGHMWYFLYV
jgi:hypothetical protein